eukprot:GHRQ01018054.1.p1 GENE.GHRQ01018054.1~~GHRQ01018054.1.p1  ORF type:complete len:210 (+),score=17.74 GHRQ01018054.1:431-1060(+)
MQQQHGNIIRSRPVLQPRLARSGCWPALRSRTASVRCNASTSSPFKIKLMHPVKVADADERPLLVFLPGTDGTGQAITPQLPGLLDAGYDVRCTMQHWTLSWTSKLRVQGVRPSTTEHSRAAAHVRNEDSTAPHGQTAGAQMFDTAEDLALFNRTCALGACHSTPALWSHALPQPTLWSHAFAVPTAPVVLFLLPADDPLLQDVVHSSR